MCGVSAGSKPSSRHQLISRETPAGQWMEQNGEERRQRLKKSKGLEAWGEGGCRQVVTRALGARSAAPSGSFEEMGAGG